VLADHGVERKANKWLFPRIFLITSVLVEGLVDGVDASFIN
jgi:hypothetical protein